VILSSISNRRVRRFRLIVVNALSLRRIMILGACFSKTASGGERTRIDQVERQIAAEKSRIRMLDAEVAYLERPRRVGQLATLLQLEPMRADREAAPDSLSAIATRASQNPLYAAPRGKPSALAPPT